MEPMSPALESEFLTTGPPGSPAFSFYSNLEVEHKAKTFFLKDQRKILHKSQL